MYGHATQTTYGEPRMREYWIPGTPLRFFFKCLGKRLCDYKVLVQVCRHDTRYTQFLVFRYYQLILVS